MVAKIKQNIYEDDPGFNPDLEIEGVGYSGKSGFDKAGLVADAIKNCVKKRGEEMHQGYKSSIVDKFGNVYVKIVPDTRKEFIGSVIALTSLLRFEIKSYSEMEDKYTNFKKTKEEILNKYIYKERKFIPKLNLEGKPLLSPSGKFITETIIIEDGRKWMPEKTDLLPVPITKENKMGNNSVVRELTTKKIEGVWDSKINIYWDEILDLCDEWFSELNVLVSDKLDNYAEGLRMG